MDTTTPRIIREDFTRQISAIVPSHPEHRQSLFRPVRSPALARGAELRNFHISVDGPASPVDGGIYGSGVEYEFILRVHCAYGSLAPEDDDAIITTDGAQIWGALQSRYDPALPGLISVEPLEWEPGDGDDTGRRSGAHLFYVRYLQDV